MPNDAVAAGASGGLTGESLSCVTCRSRKLKCDKVKPACTRCTKVNGECVYPESRRKPASKRKNVKELEERLAQVEGLLQQVGGSSLNPPTVSEAPVAGDPSAASIDVGAFETPVIEEDLFQGVDYGDAPNISLDDAAFTFGNENPTAFSPDTSTQPSHGWDGSTFTSELIDLGGIFESLPPFEVMEDLVSVKVSSPYGTPKPARAAMSSARAIRLTSMMGLHHLDSPPDESSPTLLPPRDWVELEERRRVFWGVFCIDSHCSISTGWPHLIDLTQVTTHLPSTEAAFHNGERMETGTIHDAFKGDHSYSSFSGTIIVCHLFNLILKHVHRPKQTDNPENYEYGEYWKRHREIDNTLSSAFMFLPESFRLPANISDRGAVNTNLNFHAAIICLHHAALERIETYNLPEYAKHISQNRLIAAAQEIVNIVKLTSHVSSGSKTPLVALSLFCATSVFIHFCKEGCTPTHADNLDFILSAMSAIGRTHFITRAFLRQALLDIEQNGVHDIVQLPHARRLSRNMSSSVNPYIPLLARTRLSRHTQPKPPLPNLPVANAMRRDMPISSALGTWAQNSGASVADARSHDHVNKRQKTGASSSSSSLYADVGVSYEFSYLPIRSEQPAATNSAPKITRDTESSNSNQATIGPTNDQNRIGVTIASHILGRSGPKPFTTAGREASQTKVSKGGMGSWELGGLCMGSIADDGSRAVLNTEDIAAQFAGAGDIGIDWDVLGMGAPDTQGAEKGNRDIG
ncbi:hypothetical protein NPX13_g5702 [Xylaria arbuscula]|uniref:Zn(2)-C6 fungal-type domain-containing protein n=1 Tax=Xylaria arbuscula TaxID=114810 RepID=A0A9W8TL28_9PEZI|nr:hypothetical protein NPX13_g5702 [Xylaria arbuscula]